MLEKSPLESPYIVQLEASDESVLARAVAVLTEINGISGIDLNYEKLIIAYEPIFAIGTGVSAKTQYIAEILEYLRSLSNAPLLYGGSVNCQNINEISSLKHCDGVLVGSASWDVQNFINLINIAIKDQK